MGEQKQGFWSRNKNLKVFLISFAGFVLIFGSITAIVIAMIGLPKKTASSSIISSSSSAQYEPQDSDSFNVAILGFNRIAENQVKSIQIMRVDPMKGQIPLVSIPINTMTQLDGKLRSLADCYSQGQQEMLIRALNDLTGVKIDYWVLIDIDNFKSLLNTLGKINFTLTRDITYTDDTDPAKPIVYNLKKGNNTLDAAQAVIVARFPSYASGDVERGNIHAQLIKQLLTQKLKANDLSDSIAYYNKYAKYITTNFNHPDLVVHFKAIKHCIALGGDQIMYFELKGNLKNINSVTYFEINNNDTADLFTTNFGVK